MLGENRSRVSRERHVGAHKHAIPHVIARRMLLSCEWRKPMEKRQPSISVARSRTPNIFMLCGDTAYSSWTTPMWRNPRVSINARTISSGRYNQ